MATKKELAEEIILLADEGEALDVETLVEQNTHDELTEILRELKEAADSELEDEPKADSDEYIVAKGCAIIINGRIFSEGESIKKGMLIEKTVEKFVKDKKLI